MSGRPRRRALLVLGMHRSGTSCVARIANLLGPAIGENLRPPQPDNPTGFWEHAGLSELNDRALVALGASWDDPCPLPEGWERRAPLLEIGQALRALLESELSIRSDFVVKDPRLCLLLPLWRTALESLDCDVEFLWVVRDVRSVGASLARRDRLPFSQSELLWLRYNLAAEIGTRGEPRFMVRYEEVLADWRAAFAGASACVSLALPDEGSTADEEIGRFVSPDLDHSPPTDAAQHAEVGPWARTVQDALRLPSSLEQPAVRATLDRIRGELRSADRQLLPLLQATRGEMERLRGLLDSEAEARGALSQERDRLLHDARAEAIAREEAEHKLEVLRGVLEQSADLREAFSERVEDITSRFEARTTSIESELQDRLRAIEAAQTRHRRDQETLDAHTERLEELTRRLAKLELDADQRRSQEQAADRAALAADLQTAERARAEAERKAALLEERLVSAGAQHEQTRRELHAHSEVLENLLSSRSWRITRPLRGWRRGHAQLQPGIVPLGQPTAWEELLPGRPFRQRFTPLVADLTGLAIAFFTFGRANQSSVRVRLFEDRGRLRAKRLIEETIFTGGEIRDGETSRFLFRQPLREATSRTYILEIDSIDGKPGTSVSPAIGTAMYPGEVLSRTASSRARTTGLLVLDFLSSPPTPNKAFAFVSGCPGGAYRYRCEHQAEMLRLRGYSVDVFPPDITPWNDLVGPYQVVVVHRVPHTSEFEEFVQEARRAGVHVVFDTDDLVFEPEIESQIAALDALPPSERALWLDGVRRYRKSLLLCDKALVSTPGLKRSLESRMEIQVAISRNRVNDEMVRDAARAAARAKRLDGSVRLAYLSGTPTHERDFRECVPALRTILSRNDSIRLVLAGHIEIPREFDDVTDQIDRVPLMPWQQLPDLYAEVDINLAPLEHDNEFTEGKSELKYFEAGLLGVPTVASRVGGFIDAIRDGENGFLCSSSEEWLGALDRLVADRAERRRIGEAAQKDVLGRYTSRAAAIETVRTWIDLLGARESQAAGLTIAMVVRAPIANTGGGYKKIFQLIRHLSCSGHDVSVYVEPIAHLANRSEGYIDDYCRKNFDCGNARICVGHSEISDCDVAIATNWPTANVVDALANARLRVYLVQDDEAEFYDSEDPLRQAARATYDLPLLIVGMGRYLAQIFGGRNRLPYPHVDFALHEAFFENRDLVEKKLGEMTVTDSGVLLFFARPGIPRRAFDLGVKALTRFANACPDVEIRLYGLEKRQTLPFEFVDLGVIDQPEVARQMREANVHLSFSRTNASTVMFEAMACGAVAVELDLPGVRALLDDPSTCVLCEDSPEAVAGSLVELFGDRPRMQRIARAGFESASLLTEENMCHQFEQILLENALGGRPTR